MPLGKHCLAMSVFGFNTLVKGIMAILGENRNMKGKNNYFNNT